MDIETGVRPFGATHWSPAVRDESRLEAYWRPDGKGGYDCWAVVSGIGGYWQQNHAPLPLYAIELSKPRNGEVVPPVGTVCEFMQHNSPPAPEGQWTVGTIRYVSDYTVIISGDKCEHHHHPRNCSFRPFRTPEQIAAEEIQDIESWLDANIEELGSIAKTLHEAGFRK